MAQMHVTSCIRSKRERRDETLFQDSSIHLIVLIISMEMLSQHLLQNCHSYSECLSLSLLLFYNHSNSTNTRSVKEKYGSQIHEESSDSEVEDETGELVTPEVDAQIMKTLTLLKSKNPQVYDPETTFFSDSQLQEAERKWKEKQKEIKADKPVHLKDFHRSQLLANGHLDGNSTEPRSNMTPVEEQERLRKEVKAAFASALDDQEDEDILTLREKSAQEKSKEEAEYKQFLMEHVGLDDVYFDTLFSLF